jgi:hypothetical protein
MDSHAAMKQCLEEVDVIGIRKLWFEVRPNMPQPATDYEALVSIHMARTNFPTLTARQRYYSHRWLLDHNMPSLLPDKEKPSAEKMYPKIVSGVGISVSGRELDPELSVAPHIQHAMEYAVEEAYAEGKQDDILHIKHRMLLARKKVIKKLLGD